MSVICVRVQTRQSNQFPERQSNQFLGMRSPALYGVPSTGMTETTSKTNRRKLRVTQRLGRGERADPSCRAADSVPWYVDANLEVFVKGNGHLAGDK
ncbi:hypothetical protein FJT64_009196 [Amphibalanus amphitrite]|uniref:Uncharacterized protein n=1 Tax=Amphibalanus amphitrite TaxID=1232801 RepID=A0A6A4V9E0_AMPAM|nr:hypothetical protein FJT64_009196 [Amphibalanus amphitrite]